MVLVRMTAKERDVVQNEMYWVIFFMLCAFANDI